jgi:hypothetical protein
VKDNLITQKELVIQLIKDNLINNRLIKGLNDLGFHSNDYHLHLSDIIFKLIGIDDEQEELFEKYLEWCAQPMQSNIFKSEGLLNEYANKIYEYLVSEAN